MHFLFLALAAIAVPDPAAGGIAARAAARPEAVRIDLANFRISPRRLSLVHGHAYVLELVNRSASGHDFTARDLFASARISGVDPATLVRGTIEVPANATVRIGLVPLQAGRFEFHCGHPFHAALGMRGRINVL